VHPDAGLALGLRYYRAHMSFIAANDVLAMTAIVFSMVWLGFATDTAKIGKILPGVVVILSLGTLLSNLKITPFSSTVADFIGQYVVSAAIPLLMIKADLKKIFIESGKVMIGFAAACLGIVIGVLVGYYLLQPWHVGAQVAGVYAGGFIGGTISLVAVANAVGMSASDLSVATGASMIPSVLGLMTLVSIPTLALVQRNFPQKIENGAEDGASAQAAANATPEFRLTHISGALALSFCVCALARVAAKAVGAFTGHDQGQYRILYVTVLTVVIANVFPTQLRRLRGEFELGMFFMYMFFAMIGLGTDIMTFLNNAVSLFFYVIILLSTGIVITMILCKFLRLNLAETVTGLGAAIVGPAATVAVVAGKGWHSMITPAVMTGILCHVVGNFVGIGIAGLLK
jgi:uncharacterized membrane protein